MQHGDWLPLLRAVGIDDRAARRLMAIARNAGIESVNFADLPASPTALYELSLVAPEAVASGIEHGDTLRHAPRHAATV